MTDIRFESDKAKYIYQKALDRTPNDSDKKKVEEVFRKFAHEDGNSTLSETEALEAEKILNHYDKYCRYQIGINHQGVYERQEIDEALNWARKNVREPRAIDSDFKTYLSNSGISSEDHFLIASYEAQRINGRNVDKTKKLIKDRLVGLSRDTYAKYTGREQTGEFFRQMYIFWDVVNTLQIFNADETYKIQFEIHKGRISGEDKALIDNLKKNPGNRLYKRAVINRISKYSDEFYGTTWGTKTRADVFQRMEAFQFLARTVGVSLREIREEARFDAELAKQYPKEHALVKKVYETYDQINVEDMNLASELKQKYENISLRLFGRLKSMNVTFKELHQLSQVHRMLRESLIMTGTPMEQIRAIDKNAKSSVKLSEITNKKADGSAKTPKLSVLTPFQLRPEIKHLLSSINVYENYSAFKYVRDNVDYIILSEEKETSKATMSMFGTSPAGLYLTEGLIYVNHKNSTDHNNDINLIATIVHEACHSHGRKSHKGVRPDTLPYIQDEGDAYNLEISILKQLRNRFIDVNTISYIDGLIREQEAKKMSLRSVISWSKKLGAQGMKTELNIYPTKVPYYRAYEMSNYLVGVGLVSKGKEKYFTEQLSRVISDEMKMEDLPQEIQKVMLSMITEVYDSLDKQNYKKTLSEFKNYVKEAYPKYIKVCEFDHLECLVSWYSQKKAGQVL